MGVCEIAPTGYEDSIAMQGQKNGTLSIMQPTAPTLDHEVARAIEIWEERSRMLPREDGKDELAEKNMT